MINFVLEFYASSTYLTDK